MGGWGATPNGKIKSLMVHFFYYFPKFNPNYNVYKEGFRTKVQFRAHIPLRKGGISPIAAFAFAPVLGYFGDKVLSLVF